MKPRWKFFVVGSAALLVCVAVANYFLVARPVASRLAEDPRNDKVSVWAHYQYGVVPSVLVIDLRRVDEQASTLDVLRALFHSAEGLKSNKFDRVVLAFRGKEKLQLDGAYFQTVGNEFKSQNPIYTMRTLPENVRKLDGSKAYGTWTGGLLGVVAKQMEDLGTFSQDWYLRDMAETERR